MILIGTKCTSKSNGGYLRSVMNMQSRLLNSTTDFGSDLRSKQTKYKKYNASERENIEAVNYN